MAVVIMGLSCMRGNGQPVRLVCGLVKQSPLVVQKSLLVSWKKQDNRKLLSFSVIKLRKNLETHDLLL